MNQMRAVLRAANGFVLFQSRGGDFSSLLSSYQAGSGTAFLWTRGGAAALRNRAERQGVKYTNMRSRTQQKPRFSPMSVALGPRHNLTTIT
jgi:hypothetical protein